MLGDVVVGVEAALGADQPVADALRGRQARELLLGAEDQGWLVRRAWSGRRRCRAGKGSAGGASAQRAPPARRLRAVMNAPAPPARPAADPRRRRRCRRCAARNLDTGAGGSLAAARHAARRRCRLPFALRWLGRQAVRAVLVPKAARGRPRCAAAHGAGPAVAGSGRSMPSTRWSTTGRGGARRRRRLRQCGAAPLPARARGAAGGAGLRPGGALEPSGAGGSSGCKRRLAGAMAGLLERPTNIRR